MAYASARLNWLIAESREPDGRLQFRDGFVRSSDLKQRRAEAVVGIGQLGPQYHGSSVMVDRRLVFACFQQLVGQRRVSLGVVREAFEQFSELVDRLRLPT